MNRDGYGWGIVLTQLVLALVLLPFLPLTLLVIGWVRLRDSLERRAEARAVARV
ncbi:hypothetical protein K1W54_05025 [Micromonospora sp. CPCC 205371]|nr:hypothetical protein [Micromonospora sp. CPCC 205371]